MAPDFRAVLVQMDFQVLQDSLVVLVPLEERVHRALVDYLAQQVDQAYQVVRDHRVQLVHLETQGLLDGLVYLVDQAQLVQLVGLVLKDYQARLADQGGREVLVVEDSQEEKGSVEILAQLELLDSPVVLVGLAEKESAEITEVQAFPVHQDHVVYQVSPGHLVGQGVAVLQATQARKDSLVHLVSQVDQAAQGRKEQEDRLGHQVDRVRQEVQV